MNKLNINCILKLIDQLSFDDAVKLKEIFNESKIWLVKDKICKNSLFFKGKNEDDVIKKMIKNGFPIPDYCYETDICLNYPHFNGPSVVNIIIDDYCCLCNYEFNLCNFWYCNHFSRKLYCLERNKLNNEDMIKIIKNMIHHKFYKLKEIKFDNDDSYFSI